VFILSLLTCEILKGTKPADLPFQQAVKIELIINLQKPLSRGTIHYSRRQLLANAAIAASRVAA